MRRVKQEQILRFSEVGWQVWNMWGSRLFASCADPNFHPLGIITDEEWENEEKRIQDIDNQGIRLAQQNNLEEVKRLRDSEFQRFHMKPHEFSRALPEATKTLKAFGVSSQLCLFAAGIFNDDSHCPDKTYSANSSLHKSICVSPWPRCWSVFLLSCFDTF